MNYSKLSCGQRQQNHSGGSDAAPISTSRRAAFNTIRLILLLAALAALPAPAHAAEVTIRGILVSGSNEKGESDRRLAAYLPNLKRILRLESFRHLGEDSVSLGVPGSGKLSLGGGIDVATEGTDGKVIVKVRWPAGRAQQEYVLQRGGTVLLVHVDETQAVILTGR